MSTLIDIHTSCAKNVAKVIWDKRGTINRPAKYFLYETWSTVGQWQS